MSVGIGTMSKGQLQQAIEEVVNHDVQLRASFLASLKGPQTPNDWLDFLENHQVLDSAAADYVRNTWQKFWQPTYSAETVEAIMRQSLIEAIDLADKCTNTLKLQKPMPIDCHWIWTDDQERFEVLITSNERQVLRILLTPRPPTNPRVPLPHLAPYWIVKPPARIERAQEEVQRGGTGALWVTVQIKAAHQAPQASHGTV